MTDKTMTLEQVRDWHRRMARKKDVCGELRFPGPNESPFYSYPSDESKEHDAMADAITRHLSQTAERGEAWTGEVECCDAKGFWLILADECPFVPGQKVTITAALQENAK